MSGFGIITFEEIAGRLGVTVRIARRAAREGQIPSVLLGKRRKVLRATFEDWLQSGRRIVAEGEAEM